MEKKLCSAEFSQICLENITGIIMLRFSPKFECALQTHISTKLLQCEFLFSFAFLNTHLRIYIACEKIVSSNRQLGFQRKNLISGRC